MNLQDMYDAFSEGSDVFETMSRKAAERSSQTMMNPSGVGGQLRKSVVSSYPKFKEELNNAPGEALRDYEQRLKENPFGVMTDSLIGGFGGSPMGALGTAGGYKNLRKLKSAIPEEEGILGAIEKIPKQTEGLSVGKSEFLDTFLDKAKRRLILEEQGQSILDEMSSKGVSPQEVGIEFWEKTMPYLPANIQEKFQEKLMKEFGFKPGDIIGKTREGVEIKAESWRDMAKQLMSYGNDVEMLEGTDRGDIVLMYIANKRFARNKIPPSSPVKLEDWIIKRRQSEGLVEEAISKADSPLSYKSAEEYGKSLANIEDNFVRNNIVDKPYEGKFVEGKLFKDQYGENPYIYESRYVNPKDLLENLNMEGQTYEQVVKMPTTQKYIEWYKEGKQPPPVDIVVTDTKQQRSTNRRRIVAAIEAGVERIPANVEIGRRNDIWNKAQGMK